MKVLAAYNMGPAALDRDIAANGQDWQAHLPKETVAYLQRANTLLAASGSAVRVQIRVTNRSGADTNVTGAALAPSP